MVPAYVAGSSAGLVVQYARTDTNPNERNFQGGGRRVYCSPRGTGESGGTIRSKRGAIPQLLLFRSKGASPCGALSLHS